MRKRRLMNQINVVPYISEVINLKNYDQDEKKKKKIFKSGFFWSGTSDK